MENLLFLDVPILKHIRVNFFHSEFTLTDMSIFAHYFGMFMKVLLKVNGYSDMYLCHFLPGERNLGLLVCFSS